MSFLELHFLVNMALLALRGLFKGIGRPSEANRVQFPRKGSWRYDTKNSWHWQKSAQSSEIFVSSRGICQSVGVSLRKGEHFPFWTKMVRTEIKPAVSRNKPEKWSHPAIFAVDGNSLVGFRQATNFNHRVVTKLSFWVVNEET